MQKSFSDLEYAAKKRPMRRDRSITPIRNGNRTTNSNDYYDSNNFSNSADRSGDLPAARQGLSIHPDYRAYVGTPSAGYKGFRAAKNNIYKL